MRRGTVLDRGCTSVADGITGRGQTLIQHWFKATELSMHWTRRWPSNEPALERVYCAVIVSDCEDAASRQQKALPSVEWMLDGVLTCGRHKK